MHIMPIVCTLEIYQSRDVSDASNFLLFIRGRNSDFELIETLASVHTDSFRSADGHPFSYTVGAETLSRE
jgi:hypothetical protein